MKHKIESLAGQIRVLIEYALDDKLTDQLENAVLHMDAARDRLVAMERLDEDDEELLDEEEDEDEDEEELEPWQVANEISFANELIAAIDNKQNALFTFTLREALALQEKQLKSYCDGKPYGDAVRAEIIRRTNLADMDLDEALPVSVINLHVPRGGEIEALVHKAKDT